MCYVKVTFRRNLQPLARSLKAFALMRDCKTVAAISEPPFLQSVNIERTLDTWVRECFDFQLGNLPLRSFERANCSQ